ncbi:MAG: hypothetical protein Q7N50_02630 [Armatimonadota bacterium]|nr:hypothetical protein [Armatimonadota bacterium]
MDKALFDLVPPAQMLKTVTLSCGLVAILVLALSAMGWCVPEISAGPAQSGLSIQSVEFEPIGSGKNVAHVSVSNPTAEQKVFLVDIRTDGRIGSERHYTATLKAGERRRVRCVFYINGPIEKNASITLRFYEPLSAESRDDSQYFQQRLFSLSDFQLRTSVKLKPVPESDIKAVQARRAFKSFQQLVREEYYGKIWDSVFSKDYQDAGFQSLDTFEMAMTDSDFPCLVYWDRDTLLGMRPASVGSSSNLIVLSVTNGKETWQINFAPSKSGWRVDWISGYVPTILQPRNKDDGGRLLLAKTQTFNTQHFEIHYYKNSTAERELRSIAQTREKGYAQIVESLGLSGLPSDRKIVLFFFEDMKTKFLDTGHIGLGFASGDTIGEVYNKKQHVDPYHEPTHILMRPYGEPPAILNEGVAVYMSERLGGAPALRYLGGRDQTLYARTRDFKQKGEWISLKELLTYTDIGSQGNRTVLAYIEAGAFVKFLIETFGKDKFLDAFKSLTASEDPKVRRQNQQDIERIYGSSLQKLEEDWEQSFVVSDLNGA